jgi:hypothetical protein
VIQPPAATDPSLRDKVEAPFDVVRCGLEPYAAERGIDPAAGGARHACWIAGHKLKTSAEDEPAGMLIADLGS